MTTIDELALADARMRHSLGDARTTARSFGARTRLMKLLASEMVALHEEVLDELHALPDVAHDPEDDAFARITGFSG